MKVIRQTTTQRQSIEITGNHIAPYRILPLTPTTLEKQGRTQGRHPRETKNQPAVQTMAKTPSQHTPNHRIQIPRQHARPAIPSRHNIWLNPSVTPRPNVIAPPQRIQWPTISQKKNARTPTREQTPVPLVPRKNKVAHDSTPHNKKRKRKRPYFCASPLILNNSQYSLTEGLEGLNTILEERPKGRT